jgi:hypothetical protein
MTYYCPIHGEYENSDICLKCKACCHLWHNTWDYYWGKMRVVKKDCLKCGAGVIFRREKFL